MGPPFSKLLKSAQSGSDAALGKLLTLIEKTGSQTLANKEILQPSSFAFRIGITGPPGAGKSTFIGALLKKLSATKKRVAVLSIDPTSPYSQGAILGDRIRYHDKAVSDKIFIRSMGTRGSLGGLSASAYLHLRTFDACGFDYVLIETVGVGQIEVDIMHVADVVGLLLVPESGDSIQAMKAGIIEIADVIIVNKSDRPGADSLKNELEAALQLAGNHEHAPVIMASALNNKGVDECWDQLIAKQGEISLVKRRSMPGRLQHEALALLRLESEWQMRQKVSTVRTPTDLARLFPPRK